MAAEFSRPTVTKDIAVLIVRCSQAGNAWPGYHCGFGPARGGIRRVTALCGHAGAAAAVGPWGMGVDETRWPRGQAMAGSGELPAQRSALIIGRDAGLARLRALVDPVPPSSRV